MTKTDYEKRMDKTKLEKELAGLINSVSRENDSNTPDFLLAEFMMNCLDAFERTNNKRETWYGVKLEILSDWKGLILQAIGEASSACWSELPTGVFDSDKAIEIADKLLDAIKEGSCSEPVSIL